MTRPPFAEDAEQATLGAMLVEQAAIAEALNVVSAEDFYAPAHRSMFAAARGLFEQGVGVDLVTLTDRLRDAGDLESVGGTSYILELQNAAPTARQVARYAKIVLEKATLRRRQDAARKLLEDPADAEAVEVLRQEGLGAAGDGDRATWADVLADPNTEEWLLRDHLPVGGLVVLAGEGGSGKGWIALSMAEAVASGESWLGRFAAQEAGRVVYVDAERGRRRTHSRLRDIAAATGRAAPDVVFVFRPATLDGAHIRALLRRERPALLVIDSLSRMLPAGTSDADNDAMSAVLGELHAIAEETGVCILVVHHFRKRQALGDNRPVARVRGATSIVNVADLVLAVAQNADGQIKLETAKTWWEASAEPMLLALEPGEEGGTELVFAGGTEPEQATQQEQARTLILDAVQTEPRRRQELGALLAAEGFGARLLTRTLKAMRDAGEVRPTKEGKETLYGLPVEE